MRRPTVLVGYYGMRNFGDDLFVALICTLRPRLDRSAPLWVVAPPLDGVTPLGARFLVPRPLGRAWRSPGRGGSLLRLTVNLLAAAAAKSLVLGGGSVLTAVHGARAQQFRMRRLLRVRHWAALGVSVGPIAPEARPKVSDLLTVLDPLVVRDRRSATDATRPAELAGDLAALIPRSSLAPDPTAPRAGIVYAPKESWDRGVQRMVLSPIIAHARATATPVTVLSLNCHEKDGDEAACATALDLMRESGVASKRVSYEELGLRSTIQALASAGAVITGRLHGGIVSFVCGTPFVLLSDTAKMDDFLDDVGAPARLRGGLDGSGAHAVAELLRDPEAISNAQYVNRASVVYLEAS